AAFAWLNGQEYPEAKLDHAWKILLNTQFHDALPGTHITEVYHYLLDEYEALYGIARVLRAQAGPAIFGKHGDNLLIFNPSPQPRTGVVSFPANAMVEMDAPALPYQTVTNLNGTKSVLLHMVDAPLPSMGYTVLPLSASPEVSEETAVFVSENLLENAYLRAEFDPNGELISLWDKEAQREVIAENQRGNRFQLYEDRPGRYDAWDIVASYVEHELILSDTATLTVDEQGPLRGSLRLVRAFYNSTITQRISLSAESRALTFETEVDWHERQRLLKVGFPVNINAHTATYDMAYGTIERATHRNTDHDRARFEVPAHWWMDVSEHDYGVALLNDSKYGHEANHEWMRLTLLKGSISPDPEADLGTHYFTYALYPHVGDWRDGKVIGAATALNVPLYVRKTALPPQTHTFITCDADNVSIEAVKRSEDGKRLIIRLVERYNQRTHTVLRFHKPITRVSMCDLMENEEAVLAHDGNTVEITLKPCEIATLALE
ncbi:MAG: glycoside hydrolase family 38 C-terminal domain-containing protein, partial [Chloroflexota bacterium]